MPSSRVRLLVPLTLVLITGCAEGLADPAAAGAAAGADAGAPANTSGDGGGNGGGGGSGGGGGGGDSGGGGVNGNGGDAASPGTGAYNIDISHTSVSGFSSGGFFAVQFHVAFSSIMSGAAIFAGGPFYCAQGSVTTAQTKCQSTAVDAAPLAAATKQMASSGLIDDPSHLAGQRVYIFGGAQDTMVTPAVVDSLNAYYGSFLSASAIQYESRYTGATHTFPTHAYGNPCGISMSPWVSNCSYDGAGKALAQIYGTLAPAATTLSGAFISLPQGSFIANPKAHSLGDTAYAYVPASCAAGAECRVHISFHGCEQHVGGVSDAFYKHAGFNEWADTNHLIVLYPQTISSSPGNPYACWDWWGYDDPSYANKSGAQMAMVRAMLDHLATGGGGVVVDAGAD